MLAGLCLREITMTSFERNQSMRLEFARKNLYLESLIKTVSAPRLIPDA